ncbi:hypothetical protein ACIBSW_22490 [Actinoplanes sp. NPDC049668]|uniref:hypothetical protein n=1 Tax=unclassified Actinoplanes TaxID=2626549 RepID=UPI0033ADEBFE
MPRSPVPAALTAIATLAGLLAAPAGAAAAPAAWESVPLQLSAGADQAGVVDINNRGHSVGTVELRAVTWDDAGRIRLLPLLPGFTRSRAEAINDDGVIVGSVQSVGGPAPHHRAVRWNTDGTITVLDPNATETTYATAINSVGAIAGTRGGAGRAVRFAGGGAVDAGGTGSVNDIADDSGATVVGTTAPPSCPPCTAYAFRQNGAGAKVRLPGTEDKLSWGNGVNRAGTLIAGRLETHAATWKRVTSGTPPQTQWVLTDLGQAKAGAPTDPKGLSGDGRFLAGETTVDGEPRAFVHLGGAFTLLPGAHAKATAVNDSGTVAGTLRLNGDSMDTPVLWRRTA